MPPPMPFAELTAQLEAALVRELKAEWKHLNHSYFKGALRPPSLELVESATRLGRWDKETRTIEIARRMVLSEGWGVVVEVLKHEMAHQYVHEHVGEVFETAHGPAFRDVCRRLGIDGTASGLPRVPGENRAEERIVERVARLLALAESPNAHEAEAAATAAQRLMLKYNLEVHRDAGTRGYAYAHVGKPSGRIGESERMLAMLLGRHFFVEVIWVPVYRALDGKRGSVLEMCGTPANLAVAEYVHAYLTETSEQLWREHRKALELGSNRDRRVYLAGVMAGFAEKLARQAVKHKEEGLVWVKDADLGHFFRRRHPHVRHVRHTGARKNEAFAHGREAGKRIVLRKGVQGATGARGHLLNARNP